MFGANTTTVAFHLAHAFARTLSPRDEVVVTRLDHDANVAPWVGAATAAGATVRWVDIHEEDCTLDLKSLDRALSSRTRLVAFTVASNAVGTIPPAAEIVRRVHDAGALAVADGVHFAQHGALDAATLGADVLFTSAYRFFGPHLGVAFISQELLERWRPDKVRPLPDVGPERWETGTQNHEALAGMTAAVDYLADVGERFGRPAGDDRRARVVAGMEAIRFHEAELSGRFLEAVAGIDGVRLWGIADPARVATTNTVDGVTSSVKALEAHRPMQKSGATARLVALAQDIARDLGFEVRDQATGGASDANTVSSMGVPTLDGLGPVGGGAHGPDEWLDVSSVVPRVSMLAALIARAGEAVDSASGR